jgi:NADPH:quinone reductase-like Zn-dependent oxidoreductase
VTRYKTIRIAYPGKHLERVLKAGNYGGIVGHDFAGVVEEIGPDVPAGVRTVGERVAGFIGGGQFLLS